MVKLNPGRRDTTLADEGIKDAVGAMAQLQGRELRVIWWRYIEPMSERKTQRELGDEEGVTRERIRQIEARALRRMRTWERLQRTNGNV